MKEKLAAIDVSSIEELQRIKVEQDVIQERLTSLEDKRDDVSPEVFERVHRDYEGQVTDMEDQAEPLKVQARAQYVLLKNALVEIEGALKSSEMDREELILRNDLGEFSEEEYAEHLQECEGRIASHQEDLGEAKEMREKFLQAFHSEEELEDGPGAEPVAEAPEPVAETSEPFAEPEEGSEVFDAPEMPVAPEDPPPYPEAEEVAPEETPPPAEAEEVEPEEPMDPPPDQITRPMPVMDEDAPAQDESPAEEPAPEGDGATVLLSWPKLVRETETGELQELTVAGLSNMIVGSDPDCDIVVTGSKVAERHIEIALNQEGYIIRDLDSPVGTLVNGVEVTEKNIVNGDTIQLGDVTLTFRDDGGR